MFLTITIDTTQTNNKKKLVQMNKSRIQATKGWRKQLPTKKMGIYKRMNSLKQLFKTGYYKLGKQIVF